MSRHFTPRKDNRYPFYRTLGEPQGWFGRMQLDMVVLGQSFVRVSRVFAVEFYLTVFLTHAPFH
jgi:hypothetical protein